MLPNSRVGMSVLCTPWKSSRYSGFFSQSLYFPSKNNLVMKLRWQLGCTPNRWKSGWVLSCKSKATGKCVSFRELLPNLSQFYLSSQGLCELWDFQHTHKIITFLGLFAGGVFFARLVFFCTLLHYLPWAGMQSQALKSDEMTELQLLCHPSELSVAIICMKIDCWTH